ncbi:hypothetical protein NEMIN01_0415 [Nematocida minor]|uniref:uncharacterized protein n=1 Tax=Nematocida minor TaxID=1912983 RepID=UPI00221F1DE5|nr:uncharacterized protein NEMIN01_0415 [Nematocida minor]KAI5189352.1 hypothetical protein NEMIN01_0415 [Nematocida minor]
MKEINSKDVTAAMDVISYEYISAEDAKSIAMSFSNTNTTLPDQKRLFLDAFYSSAH